MGLFFMQDEVQQNNDSMFFMFILILAFNIYFLFVWFYRFADVVLR